MTESDRIPPLNLTKEEAGYLWEMIKEEIGKESVWDDDDTETVRSLHTKIGEVNGAFDDEDDEPEIVTDGGQPSTASEQFEFLDVVSGEYCEATTNSETAARQMAAQSIGADPSDLRRIYDHSGREPEDTEAAEQVLKDALGDDYDV